MASGAIVSTSLGEASDTTLSLRWAPAHRFGFRLAFIYLAFYLQWAIVVGDPLGGIPGLHKLAAFWDYVLPWVGRHWFHVTVSSLGDGGDTSGHYVACFCMLLLAAVGGIVWSILDRKRNNYIALHEWLRLVTRYFLAATLFSYGFSKVFLLQFKGPTFNDLITPLGDLSPMQILWSFMGTSQVYTFFTGAVETLAGALLLFRRTTTLGAMIAVGALLNVLMLNLSYGVNVKLFSMNLLVMAMFLLAPDMAALSDLLFFRRVAAPYDGPAAVLRRRSMRVGTAVLALVFVGGSLYVSVLSDWRYYKQYYIHPVLPPLAGVFNVETFTRSGLDVAPTDNTRWRELTFDGTWSGVAGGSLHLRMGGMPAASRDLDLKYDTDARSITMTGHFNRNLHGTMTYSVVDPQHVLLEGKLGADSLSIRLRKIDASRYKLVNLKPFHWVQS